MWKLRRLVFAGAGSLAVLLLVAVLAAQQPGVHPISGRRYAGVMGYQGADWLEREERDIEEAPDKALEALDLKPELATGYFAPRVEAAAHA